LFNKDSIIEFLLPTDSGNEGRRAEQEDFVAGTVKSLKDVVEVKFEIEADENGPRTGSGRTERWVCPITRQELGPGTKAVYLVPCGHAFAGAAVKEISGERCLACEEPYASNDIIPILPTIETDVARLQMRMATLKEKNLAHSLKKAKGEKAKVDKKRKKAELDTEVLTANVREEAVNAVEAQLPQDNTAPMPRSELSTPQPGSGTSTSKPVVGIKNAATASLTARVLEEQEERNKRRKMESNKNINSLFTSSKVGAGGKKPRDIDFMNRGFDISSKR